MKPLHFLQLVALSALWGASFLFIRIASPVLGPSVLAVLRIGLATITLALLLRLLHQRWPLAHWRELAVLGLLSVAVPFMLYAWAGLHLPSGYSALLNSTAVIFGLFSSSWLGEDHLTLRKVLGCLSGFAGVGLIVGLGPVQITTEVLLAAGACVLASACYGISAPLMKRAITRMQPIQIAAGLHALALLMLLPGAAWSWPQAVFTPHALAAVVVMGVLTSGLAYWLHLRIMVHVTPVAAMSPIFMIPVFGVVWGHLFLGESLGTGMFAGGFLVLVACALITGFDPWQEPLEAVDVTP
ncbi:DMT family transporter [Curvibacter sp. APW13]|uniref:DMT family transporter n=1 Tax=Curvibacter sp. APW13 TaxID=3077236 RepID=UPI0028DDD8D3|nr:DMT family transporter [Curvibacter sp. APW13]MDT8990984.1 DMT family transporter [Curvibacter sp. APW13]